MQTTNALNYYEHLRLQLEQAPPRRKGDRTRARLKLAAAQTLEQHGYLNLRVSDICDAADVRMPTFYIYYTDKRDITFEVLSDFGRFILDTIRSVNPPQDPLPAIRAANMVFIETVQANPGLMRCLLQLADSDEQFRRSSQTMTHEWYQHIFRGMQRRMSKLNVDKDKLLLSIYIVGGMLDQLIRDLYIGRNPYLQDVISAAAPSNEDLAELVSRIWYHGLLSATDNSLADYAGDEIPAASGGKRR